MVKEENAILPAWELRSLPPEQSLSAELLAARDEPEARCAISDGEAGSIRLGSRHSAGLLALRTQLRLKSNFSFQTFGSPDPYKKESLPHGSILQRTYRLVKSLCVLFIFRRMI